MSSKKRGSFKEKLLEEGYTFVTVEKILFEYGRRESDKCIVF